MTQANKRSKGQFQIRHILGMMAGSAILFAILAPQVRRLDPDAQIAVLIQAIGLTAFVLGIMAILLYKRHRTEVAAGPILDRLEPARSRWVFWLITSGLLVVYIISIASHLRSAVQADAPVVVFGNPALLFFLVNFAVVRGWWRIDPLAIEISERGIILGGFRFFQWNEIQRYTWTGDPIRQLNLFLKTRHVLNFGVEAALAERLEPVLRQRILAVPG
jgi:hypothetical protein